MKHVIQYNRFIGENDFLSLDNDKFKFIIASGTNSGKTTYIIEKLLKENRPFIFLVDTIALGKNLSKKFNLPFHYYGCGLFLRYYKKKQEKRSQYQIETIKALTSRTLFVKYKKT